MAGTRKRSLTKAGRTRERRLEQPPSLKALLKGWVKSVEDISESGDERAFRLQKLKLRDEAIARACMPIAFGYHLVSLLVGDRIIVSPADMQLFQVAHLTMIALHLLWYVRLRRTRIDVRMYLWPMLMAFTGFIAFILHRTVVRAAGEELLAATGLTFMSVTILLMCPFHNFMLAVTAVLGIVMAALSVSAASWGVKWLLIDVMVIVSYTLNQYLTAVRFGNLSVIEYRTMRKIAPAQIVRHATASNEAIETVFEPVLRPVACISSDWRDFQQFSRKNEPDVVAWNLNDYYTLCETLLAEVCPEGNYYSDWIADELFIVLFGTPGGTTRDIARQAVDFSKRLIVAKTEFLKTHSMPQAIDLGISIGSALVGLMGPKTHRKATALGEFPGISRRLQNTGKLLRHHLGNQDRVVVHEYMLGWISRYHDIRTMNLAENQKLRDLDGDIIYYIEPVSAAAGDEIEAA